MAELHMVARREVANSPSRRLSSRDLSSTTNGGDRNSSKLKRFGESLAEGIRGVGRSFKSAAAVAAVAAVMSFSSAACVQNNNNNAEGGAPGVDGGNGQSLRCNGTRFGIMSEPKETPTGVMSTIWVARKEFSCINPGGEPFLAAETGYMKNGHSITWREGQLYAIPVTIFDHVYHIRGGEVRTEEIYPYRVGQVYNVVSSEGSSAFDVRFENEGDFTYQGRTYRAVTAGVLNPEGMDPSDVKAKHSAFIFTNPSELNALPSGISNIFELYANPNGTKKIEGRIIVDPVTGQLSVAFLKRGVLNSGVNLSCNILPCSTPRECGLRLQYGNLTNVDGTPLTVHVSQITFSGGGQEIRVDPPVSIDLIQEAGGDTSGFPQF